jgi:AraC-like DNA-binding protein
MNLQDEPPTLGPEPVPNALLQAVSVAEAADDVGFATPAHFVATFKCMMGVTTSAFRTVLRRSAPQLPKAGAAPNTT